MLMTPRGLLAQSLKPLLHALLVSASIPTISLAGNKRIRNKGWKYLAVFLRKVRTSFCLPSGQFRFPLT